MTSGIYSITAPDGRVYIGQSMYIELRFGYHRDRLNRGTHHCVAMQHAWNTTRGLPNHNKLWQWDIIHDTGPDITKPDLLKLEQTYINMMLNCFNKIGVT